MSVLIKGIEMPKSCDVCCALDDYGDYPRCRITEEQRGYNFPITEKRMDKCPLVPVPEHGRLIEYESRRKLLCLCGRKQLETWVSYDGYKKYCQIKCPKCGMKTDKCPSEIAAIRAWNELVTNTLAKAITEYKEV